MLRLAQEHWLDHPAGISFGRRHDGDNDMTDDTAPPAETFDQSVLRYELALRDQKSETWYSATITAIDAVQRNCLTKGLAESSVPKNLREHYYTRLAAGLTKYITSSAAVLTLNQLAEVCRRKQTIAYIFNASGYRNMQHLTLLVGQHIDKEIKLPRDRSLVLLAFVGLDDIPVALVDLALQQSPEILLILILGWLNQRAVLTAQGETNRGKLLQAGNLIKDAHIGDQHIEQVVNAWMYSSYADTEKKHDIKKTFNALMLKLMSDAGIQAAPAPVLKSVRPTIVVIHERFRKQHAMFRCYAPSLERLKRRFRLVAIAESMWIDAASDELFDEVHRLDKGTKKIHELVQLVQGLKPDIVYYPSLGMAHWTVMLAQLRLAPIQIMSHGHPSTSHSSVIDYAYVCELEGDIASLHSEKIIMGSQYGAFEAHSSLPDHLPPLAKPSEREVRVAVNSKVMKLSHRLMDICARLIKDASVPVRFSFFPGERGLYFDGLSEAITARIPEADIVPYLDYQDFLAEMCRCDLALAAFPFGNTNSTVDTCLLGLPTVANFGPESPAQTDRMVLLTAGYPEWLIARSDEEYYEKALKLIDDQPFRYELMRDVSRSVVKDRLFNMLELNQHEDPFAEMFWYVYENHQKLQKSPERLFYYKDVLSKFA